MAGVPRTHDCRQLTHSQSPPAEKPVGLQALEAKLLLLISEVSNLPDLCQKHIEFQSVCVKIMPHFPWTSKEDKSSQNSFKGLNFYSIKSNREVKQRIATLTCFCQSKILDVKCNWQDERISDKFRDCQERKLYECQINAYCSTALPSIPKVLPQSAIRLAHNPYQSVPG